MLVRLKLSISGLLFLGRRVAQGAVLSDGSQQSQPGCIFGRQTVDRLHGDGGHAQPSTQRGHFSGDRTIGFGPNLQREIGLVVEDAGQPARVDLRRGQIARPQIALDPALSAPAQADQAFPMCLDLLPGQATHSQRLTLGAALDQRR